MTAQEILKQLESLGSDSYKRIMMNHGVKEPIYGIKIEELKRFQKRIKKDYQLALDLYATGVYDAMYLGGLIADEAKMTKKDLAGWLTKATSDAVCGYIVATVAADGPHGWDLGLEWIDSEKPRDVATGWTTLSGVVARRPDGELDLPSLKKLLQRVEKTIHDQPDHVRYAMNCFLMSVAIYVVPLSETAVAAAKRIGTVTCDMGDTSCKVPSAVEYFEKARARGKIGKKRKTMRC